MPKISVIMPVYNGQQYIENTINSLIAQTCQDWELIVIDDGSTDATPQILGKFDDRRIFIVQQKNAGEASARNVGLDHATGRYISFLDADDLYLPTALEDLSSFLDLHPQYDVVYSDGEIFDGQDNSLMTLSEIRSGIYNGNVLEKLVVSSSVVTVPVCTMTRRSTVLKHSIRFDPKLVIGPDWDFWIQLAVHGEFGYLNKLTCKYRIHNTNITRRVDLKKRKRDQLFGRLKVMNSPWFNDLSLETRSFFFSDLMVNIISGDAEAQTKILVSDQFSRMPAYFRANLWRTVGINVLQSEQNGDVAKRYFYESLKINPDDRKTRFLIWSLRIGRSFTLSFISLWQDVLRIMKSLTSDRSSQSRRLQKLFGFK